MNFPFEEPVVFEDLESGARRAVDSPSVRSTYLERFDQFMDGRRKLFGKLEIPHCVVRTDDNPGKALAMFLSERKRMK
jgi:hypothetical protein